MKKPFLLFLYVFLWPITLCAIGTQIFSDNMDSFPSGWTVYNTGGGVSFDIYTSTYVSASSCAYETNYGNNYATNYMEKSINLAGYDDAKIKNNAIWNTAGWSGSSPAYGNFTLEYYDSSWHVLWSTGTDGNSYAPANWVHQEISGIPSSAIKFRFRHYTYDGSAHVYGGVDDVVLVGEHKPVLSWSGNPGYETGGISSNIGTSTNTYIYEIKYTDADNDASSSGYPRVIISSGSYTVKVITMNYVSGAYNTGAIYSTSTLLSPCSYYEYTFQATDGWLSATDLSSTGPNVQSSIAGYVLDPLGNGMQNVMVAQDFGTGTSINTIGSGYYYFCLTNGQSYTVTPSSFAYYSFTPSNRTYTNLQANQTNQNYTRVNNSASAALSWTGESGYETDGLNLVLGSTNTVFTYRIKYTDPDNDLPKTGNPELYIKKGGTNIAGSPFIMNQVDSNDVNCIDGKLYTYSTLLSTGANYTYSFQAYDIWNTSSTSPSEVDAPDVSNQPVLTWTGEAGYESDGVSPDINISTVACIYRVKYTDPDNDAPANGYPKVHIKKGGAEISNSPFSMSYMAGNYNTGAYYSYSISLSTGINYTYYFEANDIWNASANIISNSGPQIRTYARGYIKDTNNNPMGNVKLDLSGSETSTQYTNTSGYYEFLITTMSYVITPSSFAYYSFSPANRVYTNTQTHQENQDFARTTAAPVLSWTGEAGYEADGVSPDIGTSTTAFTFNIKYADSDIDAPAVGYPRVIISSGSYTVKVITMNYVSGAYNTGAIYSTSTLLNTCTYYNYTYQAKDVYNTSASDLLKSGPRLKTWVRGYVRDSANILMPNVKITLSGDESGITYTDIGGYYELLITTMSYTVTPSSFAYYSFSPANRVYTNTQTHQENQDYARTTAAPVLSWTGDAGYESDGIEPDISTYTAVIDYRVKYTDSDNDSPAVGYPRVIISSGNYTVKVITMNYVSGAYNTGAIYSTSTLLSPCSYYEYTFQAKDIFSTEATAITGLGPDTQISIKGYCFYPSGSGMKDVSVVLSDGVNTQTAITSSVGYYQFTGLTPGFNYTITPSSFAYYSFTPSNRVHTNLYSVLTNQNFTRNNTLPTLSWTNEEHYSASGVYPTIGTPIVDNFSFRIMYTDTENDAPEYGYCLLHISKNGTEISNSPFTMSQASSEYLNGKVCSHVMSFPVGSNNYSYYFVVLDLWSGQTITTPSRTLCVSTPPTIPKNKSGDAIDGMTVASSLVTLRWSASDDDNDSITYRLYLSSPQIEGNYNLSIKKSLQYSSSIYEGTQNSCVLRNLVAGRTYFWNVDAVDSFGVVTQSPVWSFKTLDMSSNKTFNYPNPFNPNKEQTRIVFKVNSPQIVKLRLYSEYGDLIYQKDIDAVAGTNEFYYDGKDDKGNTLFNGSYICRIEKIEGASKCYILVIK
ncbi:MAG: hypothetical protein PHE88_11935 [Elusimicrobia bacterium]|nr:hypothetical protein [Elusimicrobiota bacterium]